MKVGKTYCLADLHGQYDLYEKIKEFIKPSDIVYFLGDAIDRGPEGWKLLKAIYEDPQFIYLKGNHEDMMVRALKEYQNSGRIEGTLCQIWFSNGGKGTFESWFREDKDYSWIEKIENLPYIEKTLNKEGKMFILSHAGFTPREKDIIPNTEDLLWDRDHFFDSWDEEKFPNTYIVHGHTPWLYVAREADENNPHIVSYCKDKNDKCRKFDIDCGSFFTSTTALFDIDTFKPIYFHNKK